MKVLAIDDQAEALKQIQNAVAKAPSPNGEPNEVVALTDYNEALARLDRGEYFDVVITDMVMGDKEEEGLEVLRKLTRKSPVTIVLTAYPSIPNCVASLKAGAWDYLEKVPADGGDPYENLLASLRDARRDRLAYPEAGRSNPDSTWSREHLNELVEKYGGEIVAILDGQVVCHGPSYDEVMEEFRKGHPIARPTIVSIPDLSVETI